MAAQDTSTELADLDRALSSIEAVLDPDAKRAEIATLRGERGPGPAQPLLDALQAWGDELEASLA